MSNNFRFASMTLANYTLNDIWEQLRGVGVHIDTSNYESVIYKGMKAVKYNDGSIQFLCTSSDLYSPIDDLVMYDLEMFGFEHGFKTYLRMKYEKMLSDTRVFERQKKIIRQKLREL